MNRVKVIHHNASKLGVCSLFKGTENIDELIHLFGTPQGIEFCGRFNFPNLTTFRTFRGIQASRLGLYIDTCISLQNASKVILIGGTVAELTYTDPNKRHQVVLMHGAKATIRASGYAVVFVINNGGEVESHTSDNAKIL